MSKLSEKDIKIIEMIQGHLEPQAYANLLGQGHAEIKESGDGYRIPCPFCGSTNWTVFSFNIEKGLGRCWSCGMSGSLMGLVAEHNKIHIEEARQLLLKSAGFDVDVSSIKVNPKNASVSKFLNSLNTEVRTVDEKTIELFTRYIKQCSDEPHVYLKGRGFSDEVLRKFDIRFDKQRNVILFPIKNSEGKITGFSGRFPHDNVPKDIPKYRNNDKFIKTTLYGIHENKQVIEEEGYMILVEGFCDTLRLTEYGLPVAGQLGADSLTDEQIQEILKLNLKAIILMLDNDFAGRIGTYTAIEKLYCYGIPLLVARVPSKSEEDKMDPDSCSKETIYETLDKAIMVEHEHYLKVGIRKKIEREKYTKFLEEKRRKASIENEK